MKHLLLIACLFFGASCMTRKKLNIYIWNTTGLPPEMCEEAERKGYKIGFTRILNKCPKGQKECFEFVSFCEAKGAQFLSMHKNDYEMLLNEAGIK